MKVFFSIIFCFSVCVGFSQKKKQIKLEQRIAKDKELYGFTPVRAVNGEINIVFPGGIVPTFFSSSDSFFEQKYDVIFIGQDCVHYQSHEEEIAYNNIMFEYLDRHYGTSWRKEIRQDAIGLNE